MIFDPAQGRHEADGAVQRIPGHGTQGRAGHRATCLIAQTLAEVPPSLSAERQVLPRLLQADAAARCGASTWSTCSTTWCCSREEPGYALLEPIPLREDAAAAGHPRQGRPRPPRRRRSTWPTSTRGDGLAGRAARHGQEAAPVHLPLRLPGHGRRSRTASGIDGPWDVKRVLGTVPVEADGSAIFRVPANTPISVQPLDAEGKALQLMRSWFTAMPGEVGLLRRLPRAAEHRPAGRARRMAAAPAAGRDHALARPAARLQLPPRGAAGARPVLRRLPRRPAPARRARDSEPRRRPSRCRCSNNDHADQPGVPVHARRTISCTASSARRPWRATSTCCRRWSSTPTRRGWCRCSGRATTTCSSTPRPGTG